MKLIYYVIILFAQNFNALSYKILKYIPTLIDRGQFKIILYLYDGNCILEVFF